MNPTQPPPSPNLEQHLSQQLTELSCGADRILLAVSGGKDSMALLHAVVRTGLFPPEGGLHAAHLNHGLRGASGHSDADFVRAECRKLGVPVIISELHSDELRLAARGSLEEAARTARYEFLKTTAGALNIPIVATAHHAADQAETILHNLLRGTGLRGLQGITRRRQLGEGCDLIRPMLQLSADTIQTYVHSSRIKFTTDCSNHDNSITRNRLRNDLLPRLREQFNHRVDDALLRIADQTRELLSVMDDLSADLLTQTLIEQQPASCRFDLDRLTRFPVPLIRHALTVLWIRQDWPRQKMNQQHWELMASILITTSNGAADLPGGLRIERRGDLARIYMKAERSHTERLLPPESSEAVK